MAIEGAHCSAGLGTQLLRHIDRTRHTLSPGILLSLGEWSLLGSLPETGLVEISGEARDPDFEGVSENSFGRLAR